MTDSPREYDREYTTTVSSTVRRRLGYSHDHGTVTRFVLQLEYRHDDEWKEVVRYDHDPESEQGHDVEAEGLHIDIYRDSTKYRSEYIAPPMPAGVALDRAEDHLMQNLVAYIERYERWHGIRNQ
jgi:hypothetical protein